MLQYPAANSALQTATRLAVAVVQSQKSLRVGGGAVVES
jgi:hypothetical protein